MNCVLACVVFIAMSSCAVALTPFINQGWWKKHIDRSRQIGCSNMCCKGKDSSCYSLGPKMYGKTSSSNRCYCDEGCLDMEDCCEDYSVQCEAVDCVVGAWGEYSKCDRQCGLGSKTRHRKVIQEPRNGGQACPPLKESTVCFGKRCKSQRHLGHRGRVDQETARIMPAYFGKFRYFKQYNAHLDIRKNLFYKYYADKNVERKGYCAMYEIVTSKPSCSSTSNPWASVLEPKRQLCVECQTKAMKGKFGQTCMGHGSRYKETFWTAVNVRGCRGRWRRVNELSECSCNNHKGTDFIFV